jgi:hypothetical protein
MKAQNARPVPPEFREAFIRKGWRYVEHLYGARTDVIRKWLFIVGLGDKATRKSARKGK